MALWWRPGANLGSQEHPFSWGEKRHFAWRASGYIWRKEPKPTLTYTQVALKKIIWFRERAWNWVSEDTYLSAYAISFRLHVFHLLGLRVSALTPTLNFMLISWPPCTPAQSPVGQALCLCPQGQKTDHSSSRTSSKTLLSCPGRLFPPPPCSAPSWALGVLLLVGPVVKWQTELIWAYNGNFTKTSRSCK